MPKTAKKAARKAGIVREFFQFLWRERLWWMVPMILVFVLFGALIFLAGSSPVAPFIYTLF